jgi:hypothetical protein
MLRFVPKIGIGSLQLLRSWLNTPSTETAELYNNRPEQERVVFCYKDYWQGIIKTLNVDGSALLLYRYVQNKNFDSTLVDISDINLFLTSDNYSVDISDINLFLTSDNYSVVLLKDLYKHVNP